MNQSVSWAVSRSASESVNQSVSQLVNQFISQSISQSVSQSLSSTLSLPLTIIQNHKRRHFPTLTTNMPNLSFKRQGSTMALSLIIKRSDYGLILEEIISEVRVNCTLASSLVHMINAVEFDKFWILSLKSSFAHQKANKQRQLIFNDYLK